MKDEWLKNKNVIITGASSGIGDRIAHKVWEKGGNVILIARNEQRLKEIKDELRERCEYFVLDVSKEEDVQKVMVQIKEHYKRIDVLVNNAGMGYFKTFEETASNEIEAMFSVNVFGLIYCTKYVLPVMREKKTGHIIQIGSMAGKVATPKSSIYAATKHAVLGFTNALRLEEEKNGIMITSINTGPVKTPFLKKADEKGNYEKNAGKFMLTSEYVAEKVVESMGKKVREVNLPRYFIPGTIFYSLFPSLFERIGKKRLNSK